MTTGGMSRSIIFRNGLIYDVRDRMLHLHLISCKKQNFDLMYNTPLSL
jgi:hypothetical protein